MILVTDELRLALAELRKAHILHLYQQTLSSAAFDTAEARDAYANLSDSVDKVVTLLPPEVP